MDKQQPCFMRYTTPKERHIARELIACAIRRGLSVSVYDGEQWTVKNATDLATVTNALATTGSDTLHFTRPNMTGAGQVVLVWGNDEDLITDHTDNPAMLGLLDEAGL